MGLLAWLAFSFSSFALELRGVASSLDEKQQLYVEVHTITLNDKNLNQKIESEYKKLDGKVFARMSTDFSKNETLPTIEFEDFRFNKKESLRWDEDGKYVRFQIAQNGKVEKEKSFEVKQGMVAGQGFDNFVKINFQKLIEGIVPMSFGVLSQSDFYTFKGHEKGKADNGVTKFGIRLSNLIFRMFSDELLLEYDSQTKQILSYRGLSNLLSDQGKSQNVFIKYEPVKP